MTTHDFFQQIISDITSLGSGMTAVIATHDGMVLISSDADVSIESHMSAQASIVMEYGHKLLTPPGLKTALSVRLNLTVGTDHYVLIVILDEQLSLIVKGTDRSLIAPLMKKGLEQIDRVKNHTNSIQPESGR